MTNQNDQQTKKLTAREIYGMMTSKDWCWGHDTFQYHAAEELYIAVREIETTRERLAADCDRLAERLLREKNRILDGSIPSRLGIVQGNGADVDRECAALASANDRFQRAAQMAKMAGILEKGPLYTA